jgi:predicted Zn-dependent peptidase
MKGSPDYPSLAVFNSVYGAGDTSKLFQNVRERLSLCYYAGSMLDKHKGVMIVSSGVEFSNFEVALNEILTQLENIKNGDISDTELTSAKRSVMTAVKLAMDRPGGLEELYFDSLVSAVRYDPVELSERFEAVTLDNIVETASEIEPDSIYFLRGSAQTPVAQGEGG